MSLEALREQIEKDSKLRGGEDSSIETLEKMLKIEGVGSLTSTDSKEDGFGNKVYKDDIMEFKVDEVAKDSETKSNSKENNININLSEKNNEDIKLKQNTNTVNESKDGKVFNKEEKETGKDGYSGPSVSEGDIGMLNDSESQERVRELQRLSGSSYYKTDNFDSEKITYINLSLLEDTHFREESLKESFELDYTNIINRHVKNSPIHSADSEVMGVSRFVAEVEGYTRFEFLDRIILAKNELVNFDVVESIKATILEILKEGRVAEVSVMDREIRHSKEFPLFLLSYSDITEVVNHFRRYNSRFKRIDQDGSAVDYVIIVGI